MKTYRNIPIIYEDNHIIVVNKPAGILSQKDFTNAESMIEFIKEYIKTTYQKSGNVFLGLVHRLDKQVSGIMVYAKTSKAASRLSSQFRTHDVIKIYCAAVKNPINNDTAWHIINNEITRKHDKTLVNNNDNNAMHASLRYKILYTEHSYSLTLIQLFTGKKHQIRAQLSHRSMPIANDTKYGASAIAQHDEIALHAAYLQFVHPTTKNTMAFYQPPDGIFTHIFENVDINTIIQQALFNDCFLIL